MQQAFTSYRFVLFWGLFILLSTTCTQNSPSQTVKSIHNGDYLSVAEAHPIPSVIHQRPVGIPNRGGICYINAMLQVIAAFYPEEVMAGTNSALRTIIEKINANTHLSIAEDDIKLFIDSLPEVYRNPSHGGGDVVQFLVVLHKLSPFLPEITPAIRLFRWEQGAMKSYSFKIHMPFMLLYPPLDRGFQMALPLSNDLTSLIASNQEVLVYHNEFLSGLHKSFLLDHVDACNRADLSPFVLKHQHLLRGSVQDPYKPIIIQYTYSKLPNKLAIAFARPGSKGSLAYDHRDLSGTEVVDIYDGAIPPHSTRFKLAAFISAVSQIGPRPDHAIAFVQRKGQWYCVNDEVVMSISHTDAIQASKQARFLFYYKAK